ncbi:MAG: HD domain-containing protein [Bacteroidia bacterium]
MNFVAAKHYIIQRLIHELPSKLYYHGLHHTFDVYDVAKQLAKTEHVTEDDYILLKTAVLFHDAGFIEQYKHNEPIGVKIAQEALTQFGYTEEHIKTIAGIIMTTNMEQPPQTLLQKIIRDADLDYLGRNDFEVLSNLLKKELNAFGYQYTEEDWDTIQIPFLEKHHYYTTTAINKNDASKQLNIATIKKRQTKN